MIRFLEIKGYYFDNKKNFAFIDTITDKFVNIGGNYIFHDYNDFILYSRHIKEKKYNTLNKLIPKKYKEMTTQEQKATDIEDAVALILPKQKEIEKSIRILNHGIAAQKQMLEQYIKDVCSSKKVEVKAIKKIIE